MKIRRIAEKNLFSLSLLNILVISACGTLPVPSVGPDVAEPVVVSSDSPDSVESSEVDLARQSDKVAVIVEPPVVEPQRPEQTSAKAYWRQAIGYLQNGNEEGARWSLQQALTLKPGYRRATDLLAQLEVDPQKELGSEHFSYRLQYGDSLSKLADKFLNDPLKFYLLARYNDIENPGRVQVGQSIHIPGQQQQHIEQETELAVSDTSYIKAKGLFDIGKYDDAIALLENSLDEIGLTDDELRAISKLLSNAFIEKAQALENQNKILSAKETLSRAAELQPGNTDIRFHLESLEARLEIEQYFQQAEKAASEGKTEEALIGYDKVLEIDPGHRRAKQQRDQLFIKVADTLYKRALLAQRRQNLNQAIDLWDQFLTMMPENENAQLFRAKAVRMLANLQKFAAQ